MDKNKIFWASNAPFVSSGYGVQTRLFTQAIKALGYDVGIGAVWGLDGAVVNLNGMPIFPRNILTHGQDVMPAHTKNFGARYMFTLYDSWVFDVPQWWDGLQREGVRWIPWYPVDSEPLPDKIKFTIERAYKRIVYSRFGERETHKAGLDCDYIPHGIDTEAMKPYPQKEARESLRQNAGLNVPDDAFLVGMVAANKGYTPVRKAFVPQLRAFAEFKKKHSDAILYIHTTTSEGGEYGGVNLPQLANELGLVVGRDVLFPDPYLLSMGFPSLYMAHVFSAMDVHLLVSMGEGFGVPLVEAQACGTPVITSGWTACEELCFSGWVIPKEESEPYWNPIGSWMFDPHAGPITDALEQAYNKRGDKDMRDKARAGALPYDVATVTRQYWKPYLENLFTEDENSAKEIEAARQMATKRISNE